jgi:catalase
MEEPAGKLNSILPSMSSNSNQLAQHPLEAIVTGIQGAMSGEVRGPRAMHMASANEGPARTDDGPYFTNNEGIPFPDP